MGKASDRGFTSVGDRLVPKNSLIIEFLGSIDELVVVLGIARRLCEEAGLGEEAEKLRCIQIKALDIAKCVVRRCRAVNEDDIASIEREIDDMKKVVRGPTIVVPYGPLHYLFVHLARAICRRVERRATELLFLGVVDEATYTYLNRLSRYLHLLAKVIATKSGFVEESPR